MYERISKTFIVRNDLYANRIDIKSLYYMLLSKQLFYFFISHIVARPIGWIL